MDASGITLQIAEVNPVLITVAFVLGALGLVVLVGGLQLLVRRSFFKTVDLTWICGGTILVAVAVVLSVITVNDRDTVRKDALASLNSQIQEIYGAETNLTTDDIDSLRMKTADVPAVFTRNGEESVVSIQKYNDWIFIKDVESNLYPTREELLAEIGAASETPAP